MTRRMSPIRDHHHLTAHWLPASYTCVTSWQAMGLAGLHGQALGLVPFLPSHARWTALLDVLPRRLLAQGSHAFFDWPRWARLSGVNYFRVVQSDALGCENVDFHGCGNVSAGPGLLRMLQAVLSEAPPHCKITGLHGLHCDPVGPGSRWDAELSSLGTFNVRRSKTLEFKEGQAASGRPAQR